MYVAGFNGDGTLRIARVPFEEEIKNDEYLQSQLIDDLEAYIVSILNFEQWEVIDRLDICNIEENNLECSKNVDLDALFDEE